MLDLETIGYFLYMEKMEQEQRELENVRKVVLDDTSDLDKLPPPNLDKSK